MRESCSCGAAVHSVSYKRVKEWRALHRCNAITMLQALDQEVDEVFFDFVADEEEDE